MFSFTDEHYYIDQIYEEASRGRESSGLHFTTVTPSRQPLTEQLLWPTPFKHTYNIASAWQRMTCATIILEGTGTTSPPAWCWTTSSLLVDLVSTVRLLDATSQSGHWIN